MENFAFFSPLASDPSACRRALKSIWERKGRRYTKGEVTGKLYYRFTILDRPFDQSSTSSM